MKVNRDRSSKKFDSSIIFLKPYHKLVWETEQTLNMYKMCQQQKIFSINSDYFLLKAVMYKMILFKIYFFK